MTAPKTTTSTNTSTKARRARRKKMADLPTINPFDIVIVGLDDESGEDAALFDNRAHDELDQGFVKNIAYYGVTQPVTVVEREGKLILVDGRQRLRAARQIRQEQEASGSDVLIQVPYTSQGTMGADEERLTGLMVSLNVQRKAESVLDCAKKAVIMSSQGQAMDTIALTFGKSTTTIHGWFKLAAAHKSIHQGLKADEIGVTAATKLAHLPHEAQAAAYDTLRDAADTAGVKKISVKQVEDYVAAFDAGNAPSGPSETPEPPRKKSKNDDDESPVYLADSPDDPDFYFNDGESEPEKADPMEKVRRGAPKGGQAGIKRTWLRSALETDAAKTLTEEQRGVLTWMVQGIPHANDAWYRQFQAQAEAELQKAKKK